jgi:hypothetical protein
MNSQFEQINFNSVYFIKKTLRKILRIVNKYIRYSGSDLVAAELLLHFCQYINDMDTAAKNTTVIVNIYNNQLKKIKAAIAAMHEDLQYDYIKALEALN